LAVAVAIYFRIITRKVKFLDGTQTSVIQRGAGLKYESIMRWMWIGINHPEVFKKNLHLLVSAGSWKDVFVLLQYDLIYNGWDNKMLDWGFIGRFILAGLQNPYHNNLVKKYLPQIQSNGKCTTVESQANNIIAKFICNMIFGKESYAEYRKLKVTGTAHDWQQKISQSKFMQINFNTIAGRALMKLVNSKFLANQGMTASYSEWLATQPVAKFTGYPHELFKSIPSQLHQVNTLNKQFLGLVEQAKVDNKATGFICVRDTSASMNSCAADGMSANTVAKAIALYLSYLLPEGPFANHWIEFNREAKMHEWRGSTPLEKWQNDRTSTIANTNFQKVIDLLVQLRRSGVPERDFPTGIVCISDMEFDAAMGSQTNYKEAISKLSREFTPRYCANFQIILWNLSRGNSLKFETYDTSEKGIMYLGGYDPAIIEFITGAKKPQTAKEVVDVGLSQEIMERIEI
jgi:hypothetical protein